MVRTYQRITSAPKPHSPDIRKQKAKQNCGSSATSVNGTRPNPLAATSQTPARPFPRPHQAQGSQAFQVPSCSKRNWPSRPQAMKGSLTFGRTSAVQLPMAKHNSLPNPQPSKRAP